MSFLSYSTNIDVIDSYHILYSNIAKIRFFIVIKSLCKRFLD